MEPIFIYFDKIKFDNSDLKTFTIKFSDGDLLDGVLFKKKKRLLFNYYDLFHNNRKKFERAKGLWRCSKDI